MDKRVKDEGEIRKVCNVCPVCGVFYIEDDCCWRCVALQIQIDRKIKRDALKMKCKNCSESYTSEVLRKGLKNLREELDKSKAEHKLRLESVENELKEEMNFYKGSLEKKTMKLCGAEGEIRALKYVISGFVVPKDNGDY